jgi:hypothetical protein
MDGRGDQEAARVVEARAATCESGVLEGGGLEGGEGGGEDGGEGGGEGGLLGYGGF